MTKKQFPLRQPEAAEIVRDMGPISGLVSGRLRRVDILLTRAFAATELYIRPGVISCLGLIVGNRGLSQNDLAEYTGTDKSIIVSIVDTLEERGWAVREKSKTDRRRHALRATPEGEAALQQMAAEIKAVESELLAKVPPEEIDALCQMLDRMHASCVEAIRGAAAG